MSQLVFNLAVILEICKLDSEKAIFQLANIDFWIQLIQIPLIVTSNPFPHKMPVSFMNDIAVSKDRVIKLLKGLNSSKL